MHVRTGRRWIIALSLAAGSILSGCTAADSLAPQRRDPRALTPARDDDPSTCRSGYTIIEGHVYCNPDI